MNKNSRFRLGSTIKSGIVIALILSLVSTSFAFADINNKRFAIGHTYNTSLDAGYWNENAIDGKDPHATWDLGQFYITGYESVENADTNNPTFIIAPGKTVSLLYKMEQGLDVINNDPALSISWDSNGSDRVFGIGESEFGRGALFIESDVNGEKSLDEQYDFLASKAITNEEVEVGQYGDGSYRVSLDYELREDVLELLGISIFPSYTNYKNTFFFNVRTGTEAELSNIQETDEESAIVVNQSQDSMFNNENAAYAGLERQPWQLAVMAIASLIAGYMVLRSQWGPIKNWRKKKDK